MGEICFDDLFFCFSISGGGGQAPCPPPPGHAPASHRYIIICLKDKTVIIL